MSAASAIPLYLAESAGNELLRLFGPDTCDRVAIAGSVRRRCKVVHDIEVVVIPKIVQQLAPGSLLDVEVDRLEELMRIVARKDHPTLFRPKAAEGRRAPAWGARYKKLLLRHEQRWIKVDLWITTRARWGSILAIRTGDAEFAKLLVTPKPFGGMPANLSQADGALQHIVGRTPDGKPQWEPLYTPEEADYFRALDLPVLIPEQRTLRNLKELLAGKAPALTPFVEEPI